ncbi:hypothetical protein OH805_10860 [Streptomyces sp. NBC_00879]|uniref:hypothetical protein n=1 Tax=Streptomyces sp. NBC_00879 TaxID=2975855 RepID=UPI00386FF3C8|nr:hypothetical protein OH805_10860 [Streptomyces sp. NBC_00879]
MALAVLASLIAVAWTLTEDSGRSMGERLGDGKGLLSLTLEAVRACVGTDNLSPERNSVEHELLATFASLTGALAPALLLGIVLVKMFALRPFVWRLRASVAPASRVHQFRAYALRHRDSPNAVIAVRFYNHIDNLALADLRATAHLRYWERPSQDDLFVIYRKRLKVLDEKGDEADERYWRSVERGAPFTVWVPLDAPAARMPFTEIQGKDLTGAHGARLLVRLTARTIGMDTEVVDERWFDLDGDDFETGRFVPLEPNLAKDVWSWKGWREFDDLLPDQGTPPPSTHPAS